MIIDQRRRQKSMSNSKTFTRKIWLFNEYNALNIYRDWTFTQNGPCLADPGKSNIKENDKANQLGVGQKMTEIDIYGSKMYSWENKAWSRSEKQEILKQAKAHKITCTCDIVVLQWDVYKNVLGTWRCAILMKYSQQQRDSQN